MKTLIVCYSRTGTTHALAERLAQRVVGDLAMIACPRYDGRLGLVRALFDALRGARPPIDETPDPALYGRVLLGGPIWAGGYAPPLRSWLAEHARNAPPIALFSTSAADGPEPRRTGPTEAMIPGGPIAVLHQSDAQIRSGETDGIEAFLAALAPVDTTDAD